MKDTIIVAVVSALTSGGFLAFLQFLISRHDHKQERAEDKQADDIKSALKKLEKDGLRTQLLLLILLQPDEKTEILTLGQRYFMKPPKGLDGNWYMTGIFSKWCNGHGLKPDWFKANE